MNVCEKCGHERSGGGVVCTRCESATDGPAARLRVEPAAQPMVSAWLIDMRKARELPAGTMTCKRCGADVAVDLFRQPEGDGWVCSDCLDDEVDRRAARKGMVTKVAAGVTLVLIALMLTTAAIQYGPILLAPRSSRR